VKIHSHNDKKHAFFATKFHNKMKTISFEIVKFNLTFNYYF